jgi:hypothetical protein
MSDVETTTNPGETVPCPNYIEVNSEYLCKECKCPLDNADYGPGFNFESMTKCRTNGKISLPERLKLKDISKELARLNQEKYIETCLEDFSFTK